MPRFVLIGLCEPSSADDQAQFDEWFVDQHIEDTAMCPNFVKGSVFKLSGPHLDGETVSGYLSLYEVEAPSYEEAERVLNEWQIDYVYIGPIERSTYGVAPQAERNLAAAMDLVFESGDVRIYQRRQ